MRFLVVLYILMTQPFTPLLYTLFGILCAVMLAWDVYETLKPGLKIIAGGGQSAATSSPGIGENIARLLETRKKCMEENNCAECKAFLLKFQALMVPDEKGQHAGPSDVLSGAPKNGVHYDPSGYL